MRVLQLFTAIGWPRGDVVVAPVAAALAVDDGQPTTPADEYGNYRSWPEDPDEVPGWRLDLEACAAIRGIKLAGYRTKREFWTAVDLAEMSASEAIVSPPSIEPLPALAPSESARRFLADLRHDEVVGEYTPHELSALYSDFCARNNITPSAVDHVKAELPEIPGGGVYRQKINEKNPSTGKRHRRIMWIITPASDLGSPDREADEFQIAA